MTSKAPGEKIPKYCGQSRLLLFHLVLWVSLLRVCHDDMLSPLCSVDKFLLGTSYNPDLRNPKELTMNATHGGFEGHDSTSTTSNTYYSRKAAKRKSAPAETGLYNTPHPRSSGYGTDNCV
jgi:hypothetical protein